MSVLSQRRVSPAHGASVALVAATAVWGSTFIVVKDVIGRMTVTDFLFWRFAVATALLVVIRPRAVLRMSPGARRRGVLLGGFLGAGFLAQTAGLRTTSATVSGFVTGMMVVFTPLVAWLVLRQRVERSAWLGVAMATVGLGLLTVRGVSVGFGEALTLLGAAFYAFHIVGLGEWSRPDDAYGLTLVQAATVAGLCLVLTAADGHVALPPDRSAWWAVGFMAVAATAIGFMVQTWAQAHLPATRAAVILTMEPVFAGVFAVAFAGEPLTWAILVGGLLVVTAMLVVELGPRRGRDATVPHLEAL
jgi:drug/metabolite transporter (DMT)-like permease